MYESQIFNSHQVEKDSLGDMTVSQIECKMKIRVVRKANGMTYAYS